MEKKLTEITIRVTPEMKEIVTGLALKLKMRGGASDFVRMAVDEAVSKYEAEYIALHSIFGEHAQDD